MFKRLWAKLFPPKPPPPTPIADDKRDDIIGEVLRFGEAMGGNAAQAESERPKPKP